MDISWTVIQFVEDSSVEAIPSSWIQGDMCYWPPYSQQKLMSAIKKCEPMNVTWPTHKAKIFRNATFNDYNRARNKAKVAELTSDLNSEVEGVKRKRIQKVLSSSSSYDDSLFGSTLPTPPKIFASESVTNPKEISLTSARNINTGYIENNIEDIQSSSSQVNQEKTSRGCDPGLLTCSKDINTESTSQINRGKSCCCDHGRMLIELKNQNHMLRGMVADIMNSLTNIKSMQNSQPPSRNTIFEANISYPIRNEDDFKKFEEFLMDKENFNHAVQELSSYGGTNVYNLIKRCLQSTISDSILLQFSWHGKRGKKALKNLNIGKLLIGTAEKVFPMDKKSIEQNIQNFLRRTRERLVANENRKTNVS